MEEGRNFAWPVTSTNREDYLAICEWLDSYKETIKSKKIAIWGAGIRGTEFSIFLRRNNVTNIVFADNNEQKWGGFIDEFPILSPEELFNLKEKEPIIILIGTENSTEIEKQLEQQGYVKNNDFFVIQTKLYENYLKEFKREYTKEILIVGDCAFSKIAVKDTNMNNLKEMLQEKSGEETTKILAMHGMGEGAYYQIFSAQMSVQMKPELLLLMVHPATLTVRNHVLPRTQHAELLQKVYEITGNADAEFGAYVERAWERSKNKQLEFFTKSADTKARNDMKARNYFRLNYMYDFDREVEGVVYFEKTLKKAKENNVKVIAYIPPINYEMGERLLGEEFTEKYKKNVERIEEITKQYDAELLDMSYRLKSEEFAEMYTPDETANEKGRAIVAELMYEAICKFRKGKK